MRSNPHQARTKPAVSRCFRIDGLPVCPSFAPPGILCTLPPSLFCSTEPFCVARLALVQALPHVEISPVCTNMKSANHLQDSLSRISSFTRPAGSEATPTSSLSGYDDYGSMSSRHFQRPMMRPSQDGSAFSDTEVPDHGDVPLDAFGKTSRLLHLVLCSLTHRR